MLQEPLCNRFLWSGDLEKRKPSRIAWSTVCAPKKEGGLGLKNLSAWNKTLCLRLIWLLHSSSDSLWTCWHKAHSLIRSSFWEIEPREADSWTWKNILKLRPLARIFLKCKIGNGRTARFWFDDWTPQGNLLTAIGESGPAALRIPLRATVADAWANGNLRLPQPRSDAALDLHIYLTTIQIADNSNCHDRYYWCIQGQNLQSFTSSLTYEEIRPKLPHVTWFENIWFKGSVLKHSFLMWMANLNRLPTADRLISWGMAITPICGLCNNENESRDHIFLRCQFANHIWQQYLYRIGYACFNFYSWNELLSWIKVSRWHSPSLLKKVISQAVIYAIWKQRNNLLHNHELIPASTVFREIHKEVCNIISANGHRRKFSNLMQLWI